MMPGHKPARRLAIKVAVFALGGWIACGASVAQHAPEVPSRQVFHSRIEPLTDTIELQSADPRPKSNHGALQVLDWLLYGKVSLGGAYDDNIFSSSSRKAVYGTRFQPSLVASRNTGIQRTLLYGAGDLRYYPSEGVTDILASTVGLAHVWEIQRDLVLRGQFDVLRGKQSSSLANTAGAIYTEPLNYTSLFASTLIEKSFGRFFTAIGSSVTGNLFEDTRNSLGTEIDQSFRDGTRTTINGRVGYHISPIVYAFVEPSLNWGRFRSSSLNSDGYRIVGGLGTARIGLFNGEIYGGTLTEHFNDPLTPKLSRAIFGGQLSWYPTRFVTLSALYDQSLGTSDFSPHVFGAGSVTKISTAQFVANWGVLSNVAIQGFVKLQDLEFLGSTREDAVNQYGANVTYMINERLGITFEYSYVSRTSNVAGVDFTKNFFSLGGKSKF